MPTAGVRLAFMRARLQRETPLPCRPEAAHVRALAAPDLFYLFHFFLLQGTGEANFLGGVARKYGAPFEVESCKRRFFEIYLSKYCVPGKPERETRK